MKIVTNLPAPPGAWTRAAAFLGYELAEVDASRPFDAVKRLKPDVLLLDPDRPMSARLRDNHPKAIAVFKRAKPALDALPGFQPGRRRPEYVCDVAYFGPYDPSIDEALATQAACGWSFRAYGPGDFPVPHGVGEVPAADLWDAYASAGVVLDLLNDPHLALAVLAAGGRCLPAKPYAGIGVPALECLSAGLDWLFTSAIGPSLRAEITRDDTYVARLEGLLERL